MDELLIFKYLTAFLTCTFSELRTLKGPRILSLVLILQRFYVLLKTGKEYDPSLYGSEALVCIIGGVSFRICPCAIATFLLYFSVHHTAQR